MVPAGNKAKRLSSVNHTTKTIHHHHRHHFDSFLPSTYKNFIIHALLYRCFRIFSDWTKFHLELVKLMDNFKSNGYAEKIINNCFKEFLDNKKSTGKSENCA